MRKGHLSTILTDLGIDPDHPDFDALSGNQNLALLKVYNNHPDTIGTETETPEGHEIVSFDDDMMLGLEPDQSQNPEQPLLRRIWLDQTIHRAQYVEPPAGLAEIKEAVLCHVFGFKHTEIAKIDGQVTKSRISQRVERACRHTKQVLSPKIHDENGHAPWLNLL